MPLFIPFLSRPPRVNVLRLSGIIAARGGGIGGASLSIESLAGAIDRAFSGRGLAGVALAVNSPGGSPAQSALIAGRIRAAAAEKRVPVTAFVEDAAASGGYWLACAADDILCTEVSILGSIGVVSAGFGFADAIGRIGVTRRLYTAGDNKALLDPFSPERAEDVTRLREIQALLHERFKAWVRLRRGARLKGEEGQLFSGAFWTGEEAIRLGLADGVGELRAIMRERHGKRVRLQGYGGQRRPWWSRFVPGVETIVAEAAVVMETRLAWQRLGL